MLSLAIKQKFETKLLCMEAVHLEVAWLYNLEEDNFVAAFEDRGFIVMEFKMIFVRLDKGEKIDYLMTEHYLNLFEAASHRSLNFGTKTSFLVVLKCES